MIDNLSFLLNKLEKIGEVNLLGYRWSKKYSATVEFKKEINNVELNYKLRSRDDGRPEKVFLDLLEQAYDLFNSPRLFNFKEYLQEEIKLLNDIDFEQLTEDTQHANSN